MAGSDKKKDKVTPEPPKDKTSKRPNDSENEAANAQKRSRPDEVAAAAIAARIQALNKTVAENTRQQSTGAPPAGGNGAGSSVDTNETETMKQDINGLKETVAQMSVNMSTFMHNVNEALHVGRQEEERREEEEEKEEESDHQGEGDTSGGPNGLLAAAGAYNTLSNLARGLGPNSHRAFPPPPLQDSQRRQGESPTRARVYQDDLGPNMKVSDTVKRKILAGEFVEMSDVLDTKPQVDTQVPDWLHHLPGWQGTAKSSTQDKKALPIAEWVTAFHKFMYVYTKADVHQDEFRDMLAYMNEVIRIASEGRDWSDYDRKFRTERADQPVGSKMRWSYFHAMHYQHLKKSDTTGRNGYGQGRSAQQLFREGPRQQGRPTNIPFGYCYNYHQPNERCVSTRTCKYRHECPVYGCRESHPEYLHEVYSRRPRQPRRVPPPTRTQRSPPTNSN